MTIQKTVAIILLFAASGCAGARGGITFREVKHPVSMSLYLPKGERVLAPKQLRKVGRVKHEVTLWGIMYSWIPLSGDHDISSALDEQVRRAGGDGVTGVYVITKGCGMNYVPVLSILPFWPGCVKVKVRGYIVKERPNAAKIAAQHHQRGHRHAK